MDAKTAAPVPLATPPCRPVSAEMTPAEFDYYMRRAQEMRAAVMAEILDRAAAALRRLFARAKPAPRRHEPVIVKQIQSRTA